jgi:hypothetical protein
MLKGFRSSEQFFIETPMGIVTQRGDWFHATSEQIESFAPGLLQKVSLEKLIREAQAWVRSAGSLSLLLLYLLLFLINPWIAAAAALLFHWLWYHFKSGFVVRAAGIILRIINSDIFMFIISFFCLSVLGITGHAIAAILGIVFFLVMKPGLLRRGWDKLHKPDEDQLSLNDRVLKMIIIRYAVHEKGASAKVEEMEKCLKELAFNRKKGH